MRAFLSKRYISKGTGLEIAAFHNPWPVESAQVIYLDVLTNPQLRQTFPEMNEKPIVDVHVIDDANTLKCIPDESMDFVLSSHVFEHMENVGIALKNWLRVLKKDKILLMAIPLKHNYIDCGRTPTTVEHVVRELLNPQLFDLEEHYWEYFTDSVDRLTGDERKAAIEASLKKRSNIHFHCWDMSGLTVLFEQLENYLPFETLELVESGHEAFVILKKK